MQSNSKVNITQLLKELDNGILPKELDFNKDDDTTEEEYLAKIQYNTFYRTPQYYDGLMPECIKQLPGYDKMIEKMIEDNKDMTLSKAIDERQKVVEFDEKVEEFDVKLDDE